VKLNAIGDAIYQTYLFTPPVLEMEAAAEPKIELKPEPKVEPKPEPKVQKQSQTQRIPKVNKTGALPAP
jgi:hypothetical protein